jgi:hypothetical protein
VESAQVGYDVVSGVAGGAINGALLSSFATGDEKQAAAKMISFWEAAAKSKLYQNWWGGLVEGLLTEGGLYDPSPMEAFFKTQFSGLSLKRDLFIGLTDVLSGNFKVLENSELAGDNLTSALQGSFAFPGIFPPFEGFKSEFFDGTSIYNIDIFSAVNECLKRTGGKESDVVVDVILTSNDTLEKVDASDYKSLSMLYRFMEISEYYGSLDGLLRAKFAYKDVNFRYTITPSKSLPWTFEPLDMSETQMKAMIAQGEKDGEAAIKAPRSTDDLLHYYSLVRTQHEAVKGLNFSEFMTKKGLNEVPAADMDALKFLQI